MNLWRNSITQQYYNPLYIRDSRFSRLGTKTPRFSVQVSSLNRNRYRNPGLKRIGIGLGTETQTFQVSESEPESKFRSRIFLLIATPVLL